MQSIFTKAIDLISNFYIKFRMSAMKQEITDEEFQTLISNEDFINLVALEGKRFLRDTKKTAQAAVRVVLQSLSDLIAALKLDWKSDDITEANSLVLPEDEIEFSKKKFKLYNFRTAISSEDALEEMEKDDYRPATLREKLQWAKDHWNRKDYIVALGQTWPDSADLRRFSVLYCSGDGCGLRLSLFQYEWGLLYRFLAVRK